MRATLPHLASLFGWQHFARFSRSQSSPRLKGYSDRWGHLISPESSTQSTVQIGAITAVTKYAASKINSVWALDTQQKDYCHSLFFFVRYYPLYLSYSDMNPSHFLNCYLLSNPVSHTNSVSLSNFNCLFGCRNSP